MDNASEWTLISGQWTLIGHVHLTCCYLLNLHLQAYSAMLLGFIVVDSPESQKEACAMLRTGSLQPIAASIRSCLDFYSYTGAITEECKASLIQLLKSMSDLVTNQ